MKTNALNLNPVAWIKYLVLALLLSYTYYPSFVWMWGRWSARDSYYGHGFLIPIVALYWIYRKRDDLAKLAPERSQWGIGLLVLGGLVQIFSSIFRIYFVSTFSFVLILLGLVLFLFGRKAFKSIGFPIAFLSLMVPMPLLFITQFTLKMKFFVSEVSTALINYTGIEAIREGSYIYTRNAFLLVGDPCSGLRSFLAFLCLGFVFAYESKIPLWKKIVLVFMGFPLAILSNVFRVFSLGVLAEIYGQDFISGRVHDASGVVVFILAFGMFMILRHFLEKKDA